MACHGYTTSDCSVTFNDNVLKLKQTVGENMLRKNISRISTVFQTKDSVI